MKRIKNYLCLLGSLLLLVACTEDSDQSQPRTVCGVGLYNAVDDSRLSVQNLRVCILDADYILYNEFQGNSLSLPLRYVGDTSRFEFTLGDLTPDTVTIVHTNTPHFISMDAGYAMYYQLEEVTSTEHTIQSVYLAIETINANEQENIWINYNPEY